MEEQPFCRLLHSSQCCMLRPVTFSFFYVCVLHSEVRCAQDQNYTSGRVFVKQCNLCHHIRSRHKSGKGKTAVFEIKRAEVNIKVFVIRCENLNR